MGKDEGKKPLRKPSCRRGYNVKTGVKEMGRECMD